jgi:hypothetical protein
VFDYIVEAYRIDPQTGRKVYDESGPVSAEGSGEDGDRRVRWGR